jgi:hypothetical protein
VVDVFFTLWLNSPRRPQEPASLASPGPTHHGWLQVHNYFLIAEMTSIDGRVRYKTSLTDAGMARCEASHGHFCPLSFPLACRFTRRWGNSRSHHLLGRILHTTTTINFLLHETSMFFVIIVQNTNKIVNQFNPKLSLQDPLAGRTSAWLMVFWSLFEIHEQFLKNYDFF